jgi:ubiquinol-cytochrome c reductase cytochrome c subunit
MSVNDTPPAAERPRRARRGTGRRRSGRGSRTTRRITGMLALLFGLVTMALVFDAATKPTNVAEAANVDAAQIADGQRLFENSCITCHGANLQGVLDRGPSLVGVGQAAAYFQLSTGRMPAPENGAQMPRKLPVFTPDQIDDLAAYIQANGGGPEIPTTGLRDDSQVAMGGELFRLNCASCHNFTGQGGALSQGKYAPALNEATDEQIWGAMLSGPENMPKFGDGQLTAQEKAAIVSYIQNNKATIDPGGLPLGGFGPAPEGLIAFLVGMGAIVAATLWMGSRT